MASWTAENKTPSPVAWVTIDEFDNRPRVLWSYIMAALRQAGVSIPHISWAAGQADSVDHVFLVRLVSALAVQDPPVVLVLDDLHLLTHAAALQGLTYLLRNAQPGLHVMLASRMDPLLPLHRFRLTGDLAEIRADDLAFSIPESGLLLAQHKISLSPASLECLTGRTEGWAAGLRLAAISMVGHHDPEQFVKELVAEDSPVAGYLVEEVLNAQPPKIRDLLLRTSILDSFDADLASELSDEQVGNRVADLVRSNAFVQPVGAGWYRYHALFADVLRLKLRHEAPDLVPELHRRASAWYQRSGLLAQAVRHAAKAEDWRLAAQIVVAELAVGQLIEPRGDQPLTDGFARMPYSWSWPTPEPYLVAAALEMAEEHPGASWLHAAECILDQMPAEETVPARLAAAQIRLHLSRRSGDIASAAGAAAEAESLLEAIPAGLLARHPRVRAQVLAGRGALEFWSGRLGEATATFEAAIAAAPAPDCPCERVASLGYLALIDALRGRLSRALRMVAEAAGTPVGAGDRRTVPLGPAAHVALASVHLERGALPQAHGQLKQAAAALHLHPDPMIGTVASLVAARKTLAEGMPDAALQILRHARPGWPLPSWLERRIDLLESRACAALGDSTSALRAAERADPASLESAVALATAWLDAGDHQAARNALARYRDRSEAVPDHVRLEAWLAAARLSYGSGDRADGRRALQRALRLGEPERLRLAFVMEGAWLRRVLRADPDLANVHRDLLESDLAGPAKEPAAQPGLSAAPPAAPVLLEPLSNREREVLRRAAEMLDTTEIASALFISVNTVKSHLKSIYRKLAVTHRGEAVRRARQLRIL
jgi:LuxR family maltose regulon positive regulatory protein